ncbi:hypothetical protein HK099_006480 [Clydaea vesicula]|uniref:N-acetyltransferase domain-containing protein n=1 Tax=Clydaea vesicula TaxID=447962 RepID=A0AAD5TY60_9FUNG|nr:hypothetical protein HK099_006480 [Clydaea vesicula]
MKLQNTSAMRIPRPPNAFMIFRAQHSKNSSKRQTELSSDISLLWKNEKNKAHYFDMAKNLKIEHQQKYPGYVYTPQKKSRKIQKIGFLSNDSSNNNKKKVIRNYILENNSNSSSNLVKFKSEVSTVSSTINFDYRPCTPVIDNDLNISTQKPLSISELLDVSYLFTNSDSFATSIKKNPITLLTPTDKDFNTINFNEENLKLWSVRTCNLSENSQTLCSNYFGDYKARNQIGYISSPDYRLDKFYINNRRAKYEKITSVRQGVNYNHFYSDKRPRCTPRRNKSNTNFIFGLPSPGSSPPSTLVRFRELVAELFPSSPPTAKTPKKIPSPKEKMILRKEEFKKTHSFNLSDKDRREKKLNNFKVECRTKRNQIINHNRGYYFFGEKAFFGGMKPNLGNSLHITEGTNTDLIKDKDQTSKPLENRLVELFPKSTYFPESILTEIMLLKGGKEIRSSPYHLHKFYQANEMVKENFLELDVDADLSFIIDDGFSCEIIFEKEEIDENVLGVSMFVYMKKYIWVEDVVVDKKFRGIGVGKVLIKRLKEMAVYREKSILLYSLSNSIPFYEKEGFKRIDIFQNDNKCHDGAYLVWDLPV